MFSNKINQMSDPIHGSIQISHMEKCVISTQIFNRLHHVLQNSTVFMTFPSNKTSRLAHSIGVMHLGGEMFKYGVINASIGVDGEKVLNTFLSHFRSHLDKLFEDQGYKNDIKDFIGAVDYRKAYERLGSVQFKDPFYELNTPFSIHKELYYTYIVVFQSLRCAALLHDLGHPPFSHITEDALNNIYDLVSKKRGEKAALTQRETQFLKTIESYKNKKQKLHEMVGNHLTNNIFNTLVDNFPTIDQKVFCSHVKYVTLAIFNEIDNAFKAVHKIVDGVLDCDRLDYVSRDPLASGFNDGIIEYDRIIKTMRLFCHEQNYTFCPSALSLNTVEDFLKRRWKMYKYILRHHRVVKTDTLLREIVEMLGIEYLSKTEPDETLKSYQIPNNISGLWKTIDKDENLSEDDYINHFIQWDDAWLLACLRTVYFERISQKEDPLVIRLEELLSNKKKYTSLYKRLDGFEDVDVAALENFNVNILESHKKDAKISPIIKMLEGYGEDLKLCKEKGYPRIGLFISIVSDLLENSGKPALETVVKSAIKNISSDYQIVDSIFKRNILSSGLDGSAMIYYDDKLFYLESRSRIGVELEDNKALFPPFFVYLYTEKKYSEPVIRKALGKEIAKQLEIVFK